MGVLEERTEVEKAIAGVTVPGVLLETATRHPDAPAFTQGEETLTWSEAREKVLRIAAAFTALGLEPGDTVALMMPNRTEHVLADLGVVHAGGVPTTLYATLAPEQIAFVAGDCSARYAVLDGPSQVERWQPVLSRLPELRAIIVLNDCPPESPYLSWESFLHLGESGSGPEPWRDLTPDSTLTVLYTSGTTGRPKGVVITHRMAMYECRVSALTSALPPESAGISYLPLAHIADRIVSIYLPVVRASHVYFCADPSQLAATLVRARPHGFFGVPRVWEKMMAGIQAVLTAEQDEAKRAAVTSAMEAGRVYVESCEYGRETGPAVLEAFQRADEAVLAPIRALIGLDRVQHTLSAAAPLPLEVARFFAGLGLRILDVYGMTETTGAATANLSDSFKLGTVGRAMPGIEIRVARDGEILVRGTTCTPGYLNLPSAELLDTDGWVHTGDLGEIDDDGFLKVVDRKKEIIITSGGENIAPSLVENLLKEHPLVGQALAYGDGRRYVVAMLTLDAEVAPVWAAARGAEGDLAALATHPLVLEEIAHAVESANERLARVQQVKRWRLLPDEWTAESEELTPTLKLRRRVIHRKYAELIDTLYA